MKDKQQKIKYIDKYSYDNINGCYLNSGWKIVSICPVKSPVEAAAYIVLEKAK